MKIDQYLLFFIDFLGEAKCGGRPLILLYSLQQNKEREKYHKVLSNLACVLDLTLAAWLSVKAFLPIYYDSAKHQTIIFEI